MDASNLRNMTESHDELVKVETNTVSELASVLHSKFPDCGKDYLPSLRDLIGPDEQICSCTLIEPERVSKVEEVFTLLFAGTFVIFPLAMILLLVMALLGIVEIPPDSIVWLVFLIFYSGLFGYFIIRSAFNICLPPIPMLVITDKQIVRCTATPWLSKISGSSGRQRGTAMSVQRDSITSIYTAESNKTITIQAYFHSRIPDIRLDFKDADALNSVLAIIKPTDASDAGGKANTSDSCTTSDSHYELTKAETNTDFQLADNTLQSTLPDSWKNYLPSLRNSVGSDEKILLCCLIEPEVSATLDKAQLSKQPLGLLGALVVFFSMFLLYLISASCATPPNPKDVFALFVLFFMSVFTAAALLFSCLRAVAVYQAPKPLLVITEKQIIRCIAEPSRTLTSKSIQFLPGSQRGSSRRIPRDSIESIYPDVSANMVTVQISSHSRTPEMQIRFENADALNSALAILKPTNLELSPELDSTERSQ